MSLRVALILGSSRQHGNGSGIADWLSSLFDATATQTGMGDVRLTAVDLLTCPLGPFTSDDIPAMVSTADEYDQEEVREWSRLVRACAGFVIVTPQHNWGYPGELKNALDHLYHEWRDKPVLVVTYGGHGGGKCAEQLCQVLQGGLKMRVTGRVEITLPKDFIQSSERVVAATYAEGSATYGFLGVVQERTTEELTRLLIALSPDRSPTKPGDLKATIQ